MYDYDRTRVAKSSSKPLLSLVATLAQSKDLFKEVPEHILPEWDIKEFYQNGGATYVLDGLLERPDPSLVTKWLDRQWERLAGNEWALDEEKTSLKWDGTATLELQWRATGGSWTPAPQHEQWDLSGYDYDREVEDYESREDDIAASYNAGQIGTEINSFISRGLGAKGYVNESQGEDEGSMFGYVHNIYTCRATWVVTPEELVRNSIGKLVAQQGPSFPWKMDEDELKYRSQRTPETLEQGMVLVVRARRGFKGEHFPKGELLEVGRGARPNGVVPVRVKGGDKHVWYFKLVKDRKGELTLIDDRDKSRTLRVEIKR